MPSVIILCNIWLESRRRQYKSRFGTEGAQNLIRNLLSEERLCKRDHGILRLNIPARVMQNQKFQSQH